MKKKRKKKENERKKEEEEESVLICEYFLRVNCRIHVPTRDDFIPNIFIVSFPNRKLNKI
jgi:hypothetical protein